MYPTTALTLSVVSMGLRSDLDLAIHLRAAARMTSGLTGRCGGLRAPSHPGRDIVDMHPEMKGE